MCVPAKATSTSACLPAEASTVHNAHSNPHRCRQQAQVPLLGTGHAPCELASGRRCRWHTPHGACMYERMQTGQQVTAESCQVQSNAIACVHAFVPSPHKTGCTVHKHVSEPGATSAGVTAGYKGKAGAS